METQVFIDILLTLVAFFGAWVMNSFKDSIKDMRKEATVLSAKVQEMEVLVAGEYVKKDELKAIFEMLQRIDDKLDKKADK